MPEREYPGERFDDLRTTQEGLERLGYYFYPVEKEHTEGFITDPLIHRIRTQIKKRGFEKVAGKVAITFSGYRYDPREIFAIPEIRAYWRRLDRELPELPALLTYLPQLGFNGPGQHLMLLGRIDQVLLRPAIAVYDVSVVGAEGIIADATRRILQAGTRYRLKPNLVTTLVGQFLQGATHRFEER